jgi:PKD repeat protein
MESAGLTWQAFAEDASGSGTCSFNPPRGADHFAFLTFADLNTPARCANFLTATSSSDTEFLNSLNSASPANFIWLTPNDCNNMHDCGIAAGDSYLSALVPQILSSKEFTTTKATLLIVFDEGYTGCSNTGGTGECVYASFSGPVAKKGVQLSPPSASHYSYLSTIEAAWGLNSLTAKDASAPNMLGAFNAICTTNCPPPPLATSFTTSPSIPLANVPVAFTATTTGGTAPYSINWSFGDGASGTGASATHVYTGVGSFTVTETAADSSSPPQTAKSSQTLAITGPLPLSTSFTVLPSSPVVNSPLTFTAVTTGGKTPYAINWNFGDGASGTGTSVTHTFTSSQSFTVKETATDASTPAQTAMSSQSVTVVTTPPLSTTLQVSSSSPQVGQTVTFTASATGGTLPYIYATDFGDGATGTGSTTTHAYSTPGSYTAMVTVTDSASPQASIVASVRVNIQVLIPPTLAVPGNQTIIAGTWINFTLAAASLNIGGAIGFSVTGLPAGASFNQTTGVFSWRPSLSQTGSYTIVFTATDSSYTSTPTSKPMAIQVNQAAPGGSNGGNGGSGGGSNRGCQFCGIFPKISGSIGLLVIGGLLGLVASLALLTIRARASLERTKRRMRI